jgi:hypothetical protein
VALRPDAHQAHLTSEVLDRVQQLVREADALEVTVAGWRWGGFYPTMTLLRRWWLPVGLLNSRWYERRCSFSSIRISAPS